MDHARTAVVVEDDGDIGDLISSLLGKAGFDVHVAQTGAQALSVVAEVRPDIVTLDMTLPDIDGVEVCRQIRAQSDCYIMVVSGRSAEVDRLVGLEVGADDYLVKPFSFRELQARVAALFRRPRASVLPGAPHNPAAQPVTAHATAAAVSASPSTAATSFPDGPATPTTSGCDDLHLDHPARAVTVHGKEIDLTRTEFDLLAHLVSRPGVVVPREELLREVWDTEFVPESTHVVDVHLANLRRKLRDGSSNNQWIRTIRGVGFRFDPCC